MSQMYQYFTPQKKKKKKKKKMGEITVRENRSDNLECTIQRLDSDHKAIRKTKGAGVKHTQHTDHNTKPWMNTE